MDITNKGLSARTKKFYQIGAGKVFLYNGDYYICLCDELTAPNCSNINAVCLTDGSAVPISDDDNVISVNAELVVDY